jgi:hypothetical protein
MRGIELILTRELTASISNLDTSLANVDGNDFTHDVDEIYTAWEVLDGLLRLLIKILTQRLKGDGVMSRRKTDKKTCEVQKLKPSAIFPRHLTNSHN